MGLPKKKRDLLREYVGYICEQCHKHEEEVGELQPHRLRRGYDGGTYQIRNVKMVCSRCHKAYHANEY